MSVELWLRPWGRYVPERRRELTAAEELVPDTHLGPALLYYRGVTPPLVDGHYDTAETIARMRERSASGHALHDIEANLSMLPFPVRRRPGFTVAADGCLCKLLWPDMPERPQSGDEGKTEKEKLAASLMLRAEAVWDRIGDVEDALADPRRLWSTLLDRWSDFDAQEPRMDVVVQHAQDLSRVLDTLEERPRRILRRVHRKIPVGRIQEIDRKAMLWLARQPGETLAERAGDDQRALAVAREENFDTLENRVLRAYGEIASRHCREYLDRNRTRRRTRRARLVEAFGKRCARMARQLAERGVRRVEPGISPNFVLQQNPLYHRIWNAWLELLQRERTKDDLWRWQARSWEEFCSLAVMVALIAVPGARLVASSPLWFRDEHYRGRWIEADSPLGVVHLPDLGLIVEVQTGLRRDQLSNFGAPVWLRIGRLDEAQGFLSRAAVWPIWSPRSGLVPGETEEVQRVLGQSGSQGLRGGIVIRPAASFEASEQTAAGGVLALTLGTEGASLRNALSAMTTFLDLFVRRSGA